MSYDTSAPIPGWPPPAQPPAMPPPQAGRRRRPPLWALITGGVALVGLVVGLVIWQPWNPPPSPPAAVSLRSPTATTVVVSWTAPKGGATPDEYLILRDGKQAGSVLASQTSWTDTGLTPGSKHQYEVVTHGGGQQSGPTKELGVTTLTPAPVSLGVTKSTYTTVSLRWAASPKAPAPDGYTIYQGSNQIGTVSGSATSDKVSSLSPGGSYQFTVTEHWGGVTSAQSSALTATTLSAPLSGSVPVNLKVTSVPSGSTGLTDGQAWGDTWQFTANCSSSKCTLTSNAELAPGNLSPTTFTVKLSPSGSGYQGTATAHFSHCGSVQDKDTVSMHISSKGSISNGGWTAWSGTLMISAPYTQPTSTTYCPSQNWDLNLTGQGGSSA